MKSKMISLRLTREEFDRYQAAANACGMKSLSEFARVAMNKLAGSPASNEVQVNVRIDDLCRRMEAVAEEMGHLRAQVTDPSGVQGMEEFASVEVEGLPQRNNHTEPRVFSIGPGETRDLNCGSR
jgi:hypothetical protein